MGRKTLTKERVLEFLLDIYDIRGVYKTYVNILKEHKLHSCLFTILKKHRFLEKEKSTGLYYWRSEVPRPNLLMADRLLRDYKRYKAQHRGKKHEIIPQKRNSVQSPKRNILQRFIEYTRKLIFRDQ